MDAMQFHSQQRIGLGSRFLIWVAAADEETLRLCPPMDLDNVRAVAEIMIATWLYQAALFFMVTQMIFGNAAQIRIELIPAALFIPSMILLIDSFMVMRSGWALSGIEELKRCGNVDISGGPAARIKVSIFNAIRVLLSAGLALLTGIFFSLLIFSPDINAFNHNIYLQANAPLAASATALVDGQIKRANEAVAEASKRNAALTIQLTALRQAEIDPSANDPQIQQAQGELTRFLDEKAKADDAVQAAETFASNELAGVKGAPGNSGRAGYGLRHKAATEQVANTRAHAETLGRALDAARTRLDTLRQQFVTPDEAARQRAHDQLAGFESRFAAETAELSSLQDHLTSLIQGRDDAIRKAIDDAPDHVPSNDGLLGRITALDHIAQGNGKITAVIVLIDIVSFGFELAAVLAKITSFVPSTYSAILARDTYMRVVRLVDEMSAELEGRMRGNAADPETPLAEKSDLPDDDDTSASGAANDNAVNGAATDPELFDAPDDDPSPSGPRRPRGRPRKTPLN